MKNSRYIAATIINRVTEGRSLSDCLDQPLASMPDLRDRAFVQAVCYGVCRYYTQLDALLALLLEKPLKAKDSDIHALLLVGLFQLKYMRLPDYAAVTETVNAVAAFKSKPWARGLVNAILRRYQREQAQLDEQLAEDEEAYYAHPKWWITQIQQAWPDHWQAILEANNEHPPLSLRVNLKKISRDDYLQALQTVALDAEPIAQTHAGIRLDTPVSVEKLPGFAAGQVSVQDGAAQLCVELLSLRDGLRVLDACAAPGGKLTQILESADKVEAVAIEKDPERLHAISDNLKRLGLHAQCICADAADVSRWWDGQKFDRILIDAPCSASGVIRRHPDIKLLRQPDDLAELAKTQKRLLDALWPLLAPGGVMLYVTCSIFPQENSLVINEFLKNHPEAASPPLAVDWGIAMPVGRQVLPGMHGMDGFYFAQIC